MQTDKQVRKLSKFMSLVLRHQPDKIGIQIDKNGWTNVAILLQKMEEHGKDIDPEILNYIVENNNKKRFAFNDDGTQIRANQGHSIQIDLGYETQTPPAILYHGTATRFVNSILTTGLEKRNRHHVHLSGNQETATQVGKRHGKVVLLEVAALEMYQDGYEFFVSNNNVWLTDNVPVKYLKVKD